MFPFCWPLPLFINDFKQMRKMTTYMDKHSPAVITTSITNYLFWKRLLTLLVQKQENTENPFVLLLLSELLLFIERTSLRNWIKEKNQSYRVVGEELHLGSVGEEYLRSSESSDVILSPKFHLRILESWLQKRWGPLLTLYYEILSWN